MTEHSAPRRSWLVRGSGLAGALLVVALAALPTILSQPAVVEWLLPRLLPQVRGTFQVDSARFSWFAPTKVTGLVIASPDGRKALEIDALTADASLRRILFPGDDLGHIQITRPTVHLFITPEGTNLQQTFPPPEQSAAVSAPPTKAVSVAIDDARVLWQMAHSQEQWSIDPIDLKFRVEPATQTASGKAEVILQPAVIVDRAPLSVGMCRDVLVYIAPVLVDVAEAKGAVSLSLAAGRLPVEDWRQGTVSGTLAMHTAVVGAGPIVRRLADALHVNSEVELMRETVVPFELAERRVTHRDFEFGLGPARITTRGSVGLDKTLDLVATARWKLSTEQTINRPVMRALSEQGVSIPIQGTLAEPRVEPQAIGQQSLDFITRAVDNWRTDKPEDAKAELTAKVLDLIKQQAAAAQAKGVNVDPAVKPATGEVDVPALVGDAAKALLELRRERQKQKQAAAAEAAPSGEPPPSAKRPLGKLLDRLKGKSEPKPAEKPY